MEVNDKSLRRTIEELGTSISGIFDSEIINCRNFLARNTHPSSYVVYFEQCFDSSGMRDI